MAVILDESHVFLGVDLASREEVFDFVAAKAVELGAASDAAAVLTALNAREAEGSTGMTGGFAIPHCKCPAVSEPCVMVVRAAGEVAWQTMDGKPVTAAIALVIPDGELGTEHLRILSKIAVMLMHEDFCATVREASDAATIVAAINEGLED